ncbi:hypothetical protein E4U16_005172 [Claviceps sp. LM84 group G4]|nr:hypothetical protein E4U16_005172 [Claviceps sp. LM84 group G4]
MKMLNWWQSGHDRYQRLASRHVGSKPAELLNDFFTGVIQFIHAEALEMVYENLQKARERLRLSHRQDGTPLCTPPALPTPTIASVTATTLGAWAAVLPQDHEHLGEQQRA